MLTVIGIMVAGIVTGYFLRGRNTSVVGKIVSWLIYLLLFCLGISVGVNDDVMNNLDTIGLDALIVTLFAVLGSVTAAWIVYKKMFR